MRRINVNTSKKYDIIIEEGLISDANKYIKEVYNKKKIYIITDERVAPFYLDNFINGLKDYDCQFVIIEGYEKAKSIESFTSVVSSLIEKGIRRGDLLVALGGGVIGDLTGFISGTLYRGIDYIQVPTTILAQNDSSIGGKTEINIKEGKNLIGVFNQPKMVLIDPLTIKTLPKREIDSGLGEVIKHGLIRNEEIIKMLENDYPYEDILYESILVKKEVVLADEFDTGERMILNFGHTFGHVIEKMGGFSKYLHGEAVILGMLMALRLGEYYNKTDKNIYPRLVNLLDKLSIKYEDYSIYDYLPKIMYDKKNISGIIHFVLVSNIGKTNIIEINEKDLEKMAGDFLEY